ncbi:hypothetical protein [Pseudomonas fluorescens]|uniref:hypothetical protein n=1 Tax=Pseudomonas fluorescens TaxID=294 RepID=UPI0032493D4B
MPAKKHTCGSPLSRINGRTLKAALNETKANHQFGLFSNTQWVSVCPACDAYALGAETIHPWPFACFDGVMRTVNDFELKTHEFDSEDLDFCGFKFSRSALESAILLARKEFDASSDVENLGAALSAGSPINVLLFSQKVCDWGRGQRVWANLLRRNGKEKLENLLEEWLKGTAGASDEDAILGGTNILGLGVSFASKHLRMLAPEKYAVLDDVLSEGLGFALNGKGYRLFLSSLRKFSVDHSISGNLAELEAGIFLLVRQEVRSRTPSDSQSPLVS